MNEEVLLPFTELEVGGKTYMLRLTALAALRLEERLGCSVYAAIKRTEEIKITIELLYSLIESLRPEFKRSDACEVFDEYINEGGTVASLNGVIAKALKSSGFFGGASPVQES
ncbi:MAG: hypothetical protein ACI4KR_14045 [Ruminiclostridium sp.]